ncbi:GlxA family transcriptional regulator [Rhizobium bangladeshense]|uniref:GlxA family transcriptional regulator n=1 Tax=Rhizobium bangladeshense TaxID=1138189 RepID=UPI001A99B5A1|nr:helix-turn-helix domain-containing protein [Rhizobium bangladeshense]MBX4891184.1 helix-turn-helix domain-containing protein [Rhizobium bangladeshense]MBX4900924.1 helix-turn-helix domain-containing protein [Rhizobium bangladeshense]MBX4915632.1 helix-turn-helix domain-containing protein [Rhizobium bangladeshense]MBX4934757.1 helix-turn-helix domain-containing protein [Rhizobium bangladeshense]MBY3582791.1 helix-turn-helix domain-containing protein [Rhizobium bangladeshense]
MSDVQKDGEPQPLHVSLVALPEAAVSTLSGIFDVMNAFAIVPAGGGVRRTPPFHVEIVGERQGPLTLASHVPMMVQRPVADIERTDIVIVPSVVLAAEGWVKGRYPELVAWCRMMHEKGALICSACSGIFLLAETGVFDGADATVHFGYAPAFRAAYPQVPIHPEQVLVVAGQRDELVTSGASMTWHDLVLYLIARHAGATAAQTVARYFALQWHQDGLAPYMVFEGRRDHGDQAIQTAQDWLADHFSVANPLEQMVKRAGLTERTFKRRFTQATGMSPIAYVQRLRIEEAKRRLERTDASVDEVSWQVGYEEPAFFRRLFRRVTGLAPGNYRRRFQVPTYAKPPSRLPR